MEEDTIELIDYLRVIWKRKILIIVGTLICMVVAGVVSLMLPEKYRVDAIISIGKTLVSSSSSAPLDTPGNLAKSIPIEYGLSEEEALKYLLKVEVVRETSLVKIILEGPDKVRIEELIKGIVNRLIDDHLRRTESSIQPYRSLIGKLEADVEVIKKNMAESEVKLEKMNSEKVDPIVVMIAQNNLLERKANLRDIQKDIFGYRLFIDRFKGEEYKTKVLGGIKAKESLVKPKKKLIVLIAGVVGLMMSLFLAFFIEYLGNVREREGENQNF
jgi:hypothetical protein